MGDLVFVPIVVVFFALMAGFVVMCDRMIGPDVVHDSDAPVALDPEEVSR
ncbi:MAG: hypothetical protein ABIP21_00665 [Acidimicrobiia bacterium]